MEDFQQRVVDEKRELDTKLGKLELFFKNQIFNTLSEDEKEDLREQYDVMGEYSLILERRISRF